MNEFIKKHRREALVLVIAFIVSFPILLNLIVTTNSPFENIAGEPKDWILFWGSYAGSLITSGIALVILFMQMKQNHKENENNRKLQLYQQQIQWLNDMRKACIENTFSYDINSIIEITHTMQGDLINLYTAYQQTNDIILRLTKTDTTVAFIGENYFDYQKDFHRKREVFYNEFSTIVYDIKTVIATTRNEISKNGNKRTANDLWNDFSDLKDVSPLFKNLVKNHPYQENRDFILNLFDVTTEYLDSSTDYFEEVRKVTQSYLNKEQNKIEETLLAENDSVYKLMQDKLKGNKENILNRKKID